MVGDLFEELFIPVPVELTLVSMHLANGHPVVERVRFRRVSYPSAFAWSEPAAVAAQDGRASARRGEQAQEHADGRGLAGAVTAEKGEDAAFGNGHRDGVDHALIAEVLGEALRSDHRHLLTHLSPRSAEGLSARVFAAT